MGVDVGTNLKVCPYSVVFGGDLKGDFQVKYSTLFLLIMLILSSTVSCKNQNDIGLNKDGLQTFRMAVSSEPPTLDWNLATDSISIRIIDNIMEGLTQYDDNLNPIPAIAKEWKVSGDGKTYTFFLRDEVYWSDGKKLTAHDFEYSWKRLLNPETAAEYAYFLYDIENAYEYNNGQLKDPSLVRVKALNNTTLEVRLRKPVVYFPSITTFIVTFPLRKDIIEKYGDNWTEPSNIVTNGPFILKEWRHEYRLTLTANKNYYAGRPGLDVIRFYVIGESTTALTLYETGGLDIVSLPPLAIPHYKNHKDYIHHPFLRGYYYGFNVEKPPFNDKRIRQAFSMAIDRNAFPEILKGGELPATSWIPQGMFAYNPSIGLGFNSEGARALLKEAGYQDGRGFPEVTAIFSTNPENLLIAQNLQAQWKKNLGVDIKLDNQEWKVFLKTLQTNPPPIFRLGWGADYPDPDNFMNLFTSTSGNNRTRWKNSEFDRLVQEAAMEQDPEQRKNLYDRTQKILTEDDVPIMPLFTNAQNLLVKPYVKGFKPNAMDIIRLKNVWIDKRRDRP